MPKVLDNCENDNGIKGFKKILRSEVFPNQPSELLRFIEKDLINSLFVLKKLSKKGDMGLPKNLNFTIKIGVKKIIKTNRE